MKWVLLPGDFVADLFGLEGDNRQILRMHVNGAVWATLAVGLAFLLA